MGTELAGVTQLTYLGSHGSGDDVTVKVRAGSNTRLQARVARVMMYSRPQRTLPSTGVT